MNKYLVALEKSADKYRNFEKIFGQHEENNLILTNNLRSKSSSFGMGILGVDQILSSVLLLFLYKKYQIGELNKVNNFDTVSTLIGLAGSKGVRLTSTQAEDLIQEAYVIFKQSPAARDKRQTISGALGGIAGALGGMGLGYKLTETTGGAVGGYLGGGIAGAILGYKLYDKLAKKYPKEAYHRNIDTFLGSLKKQADENKKLRYSNYDPDGNQQLFNAVGAATGGVLATIVGKKFIDDLKQPENAVGKRTSVNRFIRENKEIGITFDRTKAIKGLSGVKNKNIRSSLERLLQKKNMGPYYVNLKTFGAKHNFINDSIKNTGVTMHELGHAKDLINETHYARIAKGVGAFGLGSYLVHKGYTDEDSAYLAPVGAVTAVSPMLKAEAMANFNGYKALKKYEGSEVGNKFLRKIVLPNTMSYWSIPVAAGAIGYLGAKYHQKKLKEAKRRGKPIALLDSMEDLKKRVGYKD